MVFITKSNKIDIRDHFALPLWKVQPWSAKKRVTRIGSELSKEKTNDPSL